MPGASPGARIHDGTATSSGTSRCVVRRASPAYMLRVPTVVCSANSLIREVCSTASCESAVIRPSRVGAEADPLQGRRAVADEGEHLLAGQRELHRRPGRLGGQHGEHLCACGSPFEPNPPPTYGDDDPDRLRVEAEDAGERAGTPCTPCVES